MTESYQAVQRAVTYYKRSFGESVVALLGQHLQRLPHHNWIVYLRSWVTTMDPNIGNKVQAVRELATLLDQPNLDPRLRALALLVIATSPAESGIPLEKKVQWLNEAIAANILSPDETATAYRYLGDAYYGKHQAKWQKSIECCERAIDLYRACGNASGEAESLRGIAHTCICTGQWNEAVEAAQKGVTLVRHMGNQHALESVLRVLAWAYAYRGELSRAFHLLDEALVLAEENVTDTIRIRRRMAEVYDRQKRWSESNPLFLEMIEVDKAHGREVSQATFMALLGISKFKQGVFDQAEQLLLESLIPLMDVIVEPIAFNCLGSLYLVTHQPDKARQYFARCAAVCQNRPYYLSQARLGLLQGEIVSQAYEDAPAKARQIESVCIEHSCHDLLASLRLIQGHTTWENAVLEWGGGADSALHRYQQALLHALHYNRFLLDEVLWGGGISTPVQPIIPHCLAQGDEGQQMLLSLREWWLTGSDDLSLEHVGLREAERLARDREPGDGSPQTTVVEQIEKALGGS